MRMRVRMQARVLVRALGPVSCKGVDRRVFPPWDSRQVWGEESESETETETETAIEGDGASPSGVLIPCRAWPSEFEGGHP